MSSLPVHRGGLARGWCGLPWASTFPAIAVAVPGSARAACRWPGWWSARRYLGGAAMQGTKVLQTAAKGPYARRMARPIMSEGSL